MNAKNRLVVEQFRANNGVVTVVPPRGPVLLLHTKGAKTGNPSLTPLYFLQDGDRHVLFASMGGWKRNPDWYHNLVANPEVGVEVGTVAYEARAVEVHGPERDALYDEMSSMYPQFTLYKRKTKRRIPVVVLEPISAPRPNPLLGAPTEFAAVTESPRPAGEG
jgi:deazaflavin-dependent oxidoreductase (nitroreductase family)